MLKRYITAAICVAFLSLSAQAVQEKHGFLVGTVVKIDTAGKNVVIKTADGTEHSVHFLAKTTVHGTEAGAKDAFHGLKEGTDVAVHYTARGSEESAEEIDNIGKGGLKVSEVSAVHIDRGAKTLSAKTADGSVETYRLTDNAVKDAGKDIAAGSEKSAKVTVYYTGEAGHKVAHFFKKSVD